MVELSDRRRAQHARAAMPRILAAAAGRLPPCADGAGVLGVHITAARTAIVLMGNDVTCVVVKVALTPSARRSLAAEARALSALVADDRLGDWRSLVPRRLAEGEIDGLPWAVDAGLPGVPAATERGHADDRARAQALAAEAVAVLHATSARQLSVDDGVVDRWVGERLALAINAARLLGRGAERALADVGAEIASALHGCEVAAGWIHGDYWPGNVLVLPGPTISGIVDWDAAADDEPPLHDLLHLLFSERRVASGRELGDVVADRLRNGTWTASERPFVAAHHDTMEAHGLPERYGILLYWLRQAAAHISQQSSFTGVRHRLWAHRNIRPVLAALCD